MAAHSPSAAPAPAHCATPLAPTSGHQPAHDDGDDDDDDDNDDDGGGGGGGSDGDRLGAIELPE